VLPGVDLECFIDLLNADSCTAKSLVVILMIEIEHCTCDNNDEYRKPYKDKERIQERVLWLNSQGGKQISHYSIIPLFQCLRFDARFAEACKKSCKGRIFVLVIQQFCVAGHLFGDGLVRVIHDVGVEVLGDKEVNSLFGR
jgi:hypothetical protein